MGWKIPSAEEKPTLRVFISVLFAFGLMQGPASKDSTPPKREYDVVEAYDVYAAVLPTEWMSGGKRAKQLVVLAETFPATMCLAPEQESAKLIGSAIEDFNKQNSEIWLLQRRFKTEKPYLLLPREALSPETYRRWTALLAQYPDSAGYFQVLAVGFNADKTIAVVYSEHNCGPLCGLGEFSVLQKKDGKWEPLPWRGSGCDWIS